MMLGLLKDWADLPVRASTGQYQFFCEFKESVGNQGRNIVRCNLTQIFVYSQFLSYRQPYPAKQTAEEIVSTPKRDPTIFML